MKELRTKIEEILEYAGHYANEKTVKSLEALFTSEMKQKEKEYTVRLAAMGANHMQRETALRGELMILLNKYKCGEHKKLRQALLKRLEEGK